MKEPRLLFLDFETYYDDVYSLRNITPADYILDTRYQTIMCAVQDGWSGMPFIVDGPDFPAFLQTYDPHATVTVTFNALFDNAILAWQYGFVPHMMLDAMTMARATRGHLLHKGNSLNAVSELMGLNPKLGTLSKVKGMRREQIRGNPNLWLDFCDYAKDDVSKLVHITNRIIKEFPASERRIMDLVLRCAVQPRFQLDEALLIGHLADVKSKKADLLLTAGISDTAELMSNAKFANLLQAQGITPGTKVSAATGKTSFAFAKTDKFMADTLEHDDPVVQALVGARLGVKSTLEESRCERMLSISRLPWSQNPDGTPRLYSGGNMPIPLKYSGAHTHRLSGDWLLNMQNLTRGSKLRRALTAPPNHSVITCDLSQIEARLVAWICGAQNLVQTFATGGDPYNDLASATFGRAINRKLPGDKVEGFIGKTGILGLGYGCGADKFFTMVQTLARTMGIDVTTFGWTPDLAKKTVDIYRSKYLDIPAGWRQLDHLLGTAWAGIGGPVAFGPVMVAQGRVVGPGDALSLLYGAARRADVVNGVEVPVAPFARDANGDRWYRYGKFDHKIYGAKLLENIVQFLARIIVMDAALRLNDRGYRFVLQAHDELVFIVHNPDVQNAKAIIYEEMTRRPTWGLDIPLDAECNVGPTYGDCK